MCPLCADIGLSAVKVGGLALYNVCLLGSNYLLEWQSFISFNATIITLNDFHVFEEN